jgi:hypothetical protein
MKLSAYHKQKGDTVESLINLNFYDKVYCSKTFTFTDDADISSIIQTKEIVKHGTGYNDLSSKLSDEIEHIYPDYSLYGITDIAYGFLSRGCPRNCPFCIVGKKEGLQSLKVANLFEWWRGQKYIKLSDPNLLACKDRTELLNQLAESNAIIDYNQGLDIRLMTPYIANMIMRTKFKTLHFAWDMEKYEAEIIKGLELFKSITKLERRKLAVYVLVNYDTSFEYDLYRIETLKKIGYDPYTMIYDKQNASQKIKYLARWTNNKIIYNQCEKFSDYDCKRG